MRPVPGAGWEPHEVAGNFPGAQRARRCPSHRREHNGHVAGEPDGLYSRQRRTRDHRVGICLALCLAAGPPASHAGLTFQ